MNPSPKDISFFDFTVVDLYTKELLFYVSNATLDGLGIKDQSLFTPAGQQLARLNYPNSNYGTFKANSFNRLDIAFYPQNSKSKIRILFKVTILALYTNGIRTAINIYLWP